MPKSTQKELSRAVQRNRTDELRQGDLPLLAQQGTSSLLARQKKGHLSFWLGRCRVTMACRSIRYFVASAPIFLYRRPLFSL